MVFSLIKNISNRIRNAIDSLLGEKRIPKSVRNVLEKEGSRKIKSIQVFRNPIQSSGRILMDFLSLGKFSELKKKFNPDDLFHTGMIITLDNGKVYTLEKVEIISIKSGKPSSIKDSIKVPVDKDISLSELLYNAQKRNPEKFLSYNATTNNCQHFLAMLLQSSGLMTPEAREFILQNTEELVKNLPEISKYLAEKITDVAGKVSEATEELTMRRGGRIVKKYRI